MITDRQQQSFREQGYVVLPGALSSADMDALEAENKRLNAHAQLLLNQLAKSGESLADYYRRQEAELIVVPEIDDPGKVCRFEYIDASSEVVHNRILPTVASAIESLTGQAFKLFKDKCNEKNPGGGAFEPHQDVIAYDQFAPRYHVTAAIFLDDATSENGCLNFPKDYLSDVADAGEYQTKTLMGNLPVLPSYDGGPDNGNIRREVCEQIHWQEVPAKRGDVVLFDSYVPHYSEKNASDKTRRAMFFTFNPASDGDFYEDYYLMKRNQFDNPKFHVATPTSHAKIAV